MDISLTTGAMTKIATRSYQKFISSVWTNYLIQHWASLEIWMTRIELMDRYTLILTWLRILMASFFLKVTKPYEIIWPTVPITTGRLQLSSGQCLTTIFSIFIKVRKITSKSQSLKSNLWKLQDKKGGIDNNFLWVCWFLCKALSNFNPPLENSTTRTALLTPHLRFGLLHL